MQQQACFSNLTLCWLLTSIGDLVICEEVCGARVAECVVADELECRVGQQRALLVDVLDGEPGCEEGRRAPCEGVGVGLVARAHQVRAAQKAQPQREGLGQSDSTGSEMHGQQQHQRAEQREQPAQSTQRRAAVTEEEEVARRGAGGGGGGA